MAISRRTFLVGGAGALVLAACSGGDDDAPEAGPTTTTTTSTTVPTTTAPAVPLTADPFALGVASGEPDATGAVIWTRLLGAEGDHDVIWEVDGVGTGVVRATPADGHAVKVVVDGLAPGTWHDYRFRTATYTSPTGRVRTATGDELRFAFASCQDWRDGHYAAHEHLAAEDVDLVVWLGDYIYEGPSSDDGIRPHDGPACETLDQYRARYALYRSDPNLRAAHERAPWFVIWDDHEVRNNYTRDVDPARRAAAYQAWWEHMPTRLPKPAADTLNSNRSLEWGGLATFFALDGRQHRSAQPCGGGIVADCPDRTNADGTMLGAEQEAWVAEVMPASTSTWNVVANQTVMAPSPIDLGVTTLFNMDQWDGYPAAQRRMLEVLSRTTNPVVITGDIHASAVGDIELDDDVVGVELIGTSISSEFPADLAAFFEVAAVDAGAQMADATHRGYVVCHLTAETFTADYRIVESVMTPSSPVSTSSSWRIDAGTPGVKPLT